MHTSSCKIKEKTIYIIVLENIKLDFEHPESKTISKKCACVRAHTHTLKIIFSHEIMSFAHIYNYSLYVET